ncbi:MAG: NADH-quinone oxidoreductase subunit NuoE [Thermoleophilia bacterium]
MARRSDRVDVTSPAQVANGGLDVSRIMDMIAEGDGRGNLIALLQRAQEAFGYLPQAVVDEIARLTGIPASRIYGVITFYAQFSTVPSGRHKICVCHGTACHVAGASRITEAFEQELGVCDGGTTDDMEFTLDSVACMGACSQAPVMRIDDETYGNLSSDEVRRIIRTMAKELGLEYGADRVGGKGGEGDV